MSGKHMRPSTRRSFQRPLAVIGTAAILVVGFDAATYAATGSPALLGKINKAGAPTVIQNTGAGPVLSLQTSASKYAPFATNAKGKVTNLNADKVDGLDAATLVTKAKTNVNAVTLNGKSAATIVSEARANVNAATLNGKTAAAVVADAKAATRAFAVVRSDAVVSKQSGGITVTQPIAGYYCVSAPGFSNTTGVALASGEWYSDSTTAGTPGIFVHVETTSFASDTCGTGFLVTTYSVVGGTVSNSSQPFTIVIF